MSTTEYAERLMARYEPQVPIAELVEHLNRFYHAREARYYDGQHPEIHRQIVPIWSEMLDVGLAGDTGRPLRVFDFGCGTGFEATRLLEHGRKARIGRLVCYDLSPEMLERCRGRLQGCSCPTEFVSDLSEVNVADGRFDVLMTNSLLHHLPDPLGMLRRVTPLLTENAVWFAGHEPSSRFYRNEACCQALAGYLRQRKLGKYASLRNWFNRARRLLRFRRDPAYGAAWAALDAGLVKRKPSAEAVGRLVDFHVAHSPKEAEAGRGFDFVELEGKLRGQWDLVWTRSYGFMGSFYEGRLPEKWRSVCRGLQRDFPNDGQNFCAVWRRPSAA